MNWKNKRVLVTGSEGLIGKELCILLEDLGAEVYHYDLKKIDSRLAVLKDVTYKKELEDTFKFFEPEYVFHLFGIKGSPKRTNQFPVDFMGPMLQGDTNVILACQKYKVKGMLYTSSIAVENPEDDKYPAWAKMTAETLIQAMRVQYPKGTEYCIVRPANVYGRFDNFDAEHPMVITSLIKKGLNDDVIHVWGDGNQVRDFINAKDVAKGMIQAMEEMNEEPVNLCSGKGVTISKIANIIKDELDKIIVYDDNNQGSDSRVMNLNWNFNPEIDIEEGIKEVIKWKKKEEN